MRHTQGGFDHRFYPGDYQVETEITEDSKGKLHILFLV